MNKRVTLLIQIICLTLVFTVLAVIPTSAQGPEEAEAEAVAAVEAQLQKYIQAFRTADLESFKELYWRDPALTVYWPGSGGDQVLLVEGWAQWEAYLPNVFNAWAQLPDGGVNVHLRHPRFRVMDDMAIITTYAFFLDIPTPEGGTTTRFFRATLVLAEQADGEWLIVHEHIDEFQTGF